MDRNQFWTLIDSARRVSGFDDEQFLRALQSKLRTLTPEDLISFDILQDELRDESYRRELWAAAYLINAGATDDGFDNFRAWLISQGRQVFENALKDPDSLAAIVSDDMNGEAELEDFLYLHRQVYEAKTGQKFPARPRSGRQLSGVEWKEANLEALLPRLTAKLNSREDD